MTIADIAVAFSVYLVYRCNPLQANVFTSKYKNVYRHYNTVMCNPRIHKLLCSENFSLDLFNSSAKPDAAPSTL